MKRRVLFLLLAAATAAAQEPGVERVFTLEQSIQTAMANNPSLLAARAEVKSAEQRVREARASFLPKVDLQLNGSRYLAEEATIVSPDLGGTLLRPSRNVLADNFYAARLGMKQILYNGGRLGTNVRLAKAALEQARIHEEELRGAVVMNSVKSFYDVLLARNRKDLAEEASRRVDRFLDKTPAWDDGSRAVWEALQGRFRRDLAASRRSEERATLDFLGTTGLELYTLVALKGTLSSTEVSLDLPKLLAWAHQSRLDIQATNFQDEIDQLAVNLSKAARYPVIALGGAYEYNDPEFPLRTQLWHATLNVSLPVFDGFSSRARIRQARYQAERNRVLRSRLEDQVNAEVRTAYGDVVYWQKEMVLRRTEMERSRKALKDLERSRNLPARATAESWALEAGQAYWESVHGHRVSLARLEKAVGRAVQ